MPDQLTPFMQRYQHLRALRDSGRMPPQQFAAEVQKLRWQDASGAWWMVDPNGVALRYDGRQWQPVGPPPPPAPANGPPPPAAAAPQAAAPQGAAPARAPAPNPTAAKARRFVPRALLPILPLIPVLLCGGSWFLYTFLGVFKYEGIAGVDWMTPLIIVGLPALFWLLDKPLDKLFMPLKPVIQGVPKALRLGVCFAIPIVLGLALGALSDSGYGMLRFTSLVSVLAAAVLLRF